MPGPMLPERTVNPLGLPTWLATALANLSLSPASTAIEAGDAALPLAKAGGKAITDRLGEIFSPASTTAGVPQRIRLTSFRPDTHVLQFHGVQNGEPMDATLHQFQQLLNGDALGPEPGPFDGKSVPQLVRTLLGMLK